MLLVLRENCVGGKGWLKMHVSITSDHHEALGGLLAALIKEKMPEDSILMISCLRKPSSGEFVVTADVGGPEPTI